MRALRLFAEYVVEERAVVLNNAASGPGGADGAALGGRAPAWQGALLETQRAFDGVASGYDRSNTSNRTLSGMRERARQTVESVVPRGAHLLAAAAPDPTPSVSRAADTT